MFRRRRPLMRAAVVGGGAYAVGKRPRGVAKGNSRKEQDERLDPGEHGHPGSGQDAPAAAPSMPDQLNQLAACTSGRADRRRIRHGQGQAAQRLGAEQPPDPDPGYRGR